MQMTIEQADEQIKALTSQLIAAREEINRTRVAIAKALTSPGEQAHKILLNILET